MACDRCWDGRHCRGRDCQNCSVCQDIRENKFDLKRRTSLKPRTRTPGLGSPRGPRGPRPFVESRKRTVLVDPILAAAITDQLESGASVTSIVNHTNFTRGQVLAVKEGHHG